ncbi:MAG: glycoside hydrolase family 3 N-terminal domain-containing protein [bacterium]
MLKPLTVSQKKKIDSLMSSMSIEQMVGQTLCPVAWHFGVHPDEKALGPILDTLKKKIEKYQLGSIFLAFGTADIFKRVESEIRNSLDVPVIINADMENGAGTRLSDKVKFPWAMACGAANNVKLVELMGEATGVESRACGVHWTLGPVVDLALRHDNPMMIGRAFGCDPRHVARMSTAFIRGVQKNGNMAATAKHFPGDGSEDREPHICTAVIDMTRKQWFDSYGVTWKAAIDAGVMSVMTGHIGLPFVDKGRDFRGPTPATLSKKLQLDFLRGELGFDGCIICDAVCMIGFASWVAHADRAWMSIESGTDCHLFSEVDTDYPNMLRALKEKKLSEERVAFAARKMLELKARVGLFDGYAIKDPPKAVEKTYRAVAVELARRSITIARNEGGVLPLKLKKGAKVLTVSCCFTTGVRHGVDQDLEVLDEELKKRGFVVDHLVNPGGGDILAKMKDYEAIFVNLNIPPRYGSNKLVPPVSNAFWDGFWTGHPQVVFTSFGDPFKIYEMPYVPNWIMTFSNTDESQAACVKAWLGEEDFMGKCPVRLKGFLECEV